VSLSADYVGKGFGRYYYDVDASRQPGERSWRLWRRQATEAGFAKLSLGIVGAKSLSGDLRKGWAVFALGGYGRLLGRYADSPLVKDAGSRNQWLGGLGVAYTF
jgi:outer membrane protein